MIDGRRDRAPDARDGTSESEGTTRQSSLIQLLIRMGVTADGITVLGIVLALATAIVVGAGYLYVGAALLTAGGLMDALDGVIAKAAGTSSIRGAFVDSVADRVSDGLIFGGVCWYLALHHDPRTAVLPVAILAVSALISYERAKAESLGFVARGGLMERAERLILLGIALVTHVIFVPLLALLLGLSVLTAVGRFVKVMRQANGHVEPEHATRPLQMGLDAHWRAWRDAGRAESSRRRRRQRETLSIRLRDVLSSDRVSSGPTRMKPARIKTVHGKRARALRRQAADRHL